MSILSRTILQLSKGDTATNRRWFLWIAIVFSLLCCILLSLSWGRSGFSWWQIWSSDPQSTAVAWSIEWVRWPRTLGAMGAGACLAISGCLLQQITRNPLADPGILGINGGAGLAVVLWLLSFSKNNIVPYWHLPLVACAGAVMVATILAILLWQSTSRNPMVVLLIGVAIGAGTSALARTFAVVLDPQLLNWLIAWQSGTLSGISLDSALCLLGFSVIGLLCSIPLSRHLQVWSLGDELSFALGVDVDPLCRRTLILAACLGGISVAMVGGISLLGFLAPHLSRHVLKSKGMDQLVGSALLGALLLLLADTLGRNFLLWRELPAGVLIGILGAPLFLLALSRWRS